jgi:hypothetical protein
MYFNYVKICVLVNISFMFKEIVYNLEIILLIFIGQGFCDFSKHIYNWV